MIRTNLNNLNKKEKKLTIGCILARVDEEYQNKICSGISYFCKKNDINLIYFAGRSLNNPNEFEGLSNIIFDLVSSDVVDGLIFLPCILGNFISNKDLLEFLYKYHELPSVSIAMKHKDMHSLIIDNKKGMYDLLIHIIEVHNVDQIAFIKGPENNIEALERFEAYKKALNNKNIPFNSDLIIQGSFLENDGKEAVRILLDEKKIKFKVIVASNDSMAIGALVELKSRGYSIPLDYIVTGFDDLPRSNVTNPPLTTVRQPLFKIGKCAGETITKLIKGEMDTNETKFDTELILRRSCGCTAEILNGVSINNFNKDSQSENESLTNKQILKKLIFSIRKKDFEIDPTHIEELNDAFQREIYNNEKNVFMGIFENIITQYSLNHKNLDIWNYIISEFRHVYIPNIFNNNNLLIKSEDLWHKSRLLIGETEKRNYGFKSYLEHRESRLFLHAIESFNIAHGISNLLKLIIQKISLFGIKSAYLSFFEKSNKNPIEWSKMVLYFMDNRICEVNTNSIENRFLSRNLIPSNLIQNNRQFEWVVEALRSKDRAHYGFIVLETKEDFSSNYSDISFHISMALEEAFHFEERESLMNKLEISNTELEEFAYIVSHDLKNPLHTISGFLELLKLKFKTKLNKEAIDIIDLCLKSGEKMTIFITNILDYSRLSTQIEPFKQLNTNQIIKDVFLNLKNIIDLKKAQITYDHLPNIIGDETQLTQLFQNLIDNAIKFQNYQIPKIHIGVKEEKERWIFSISDNGIGIDPKNYKSIFKMFSRIHNDKKYPGNGIGLAFCKKIIERHGGQIWLMSKIEKGTTFFFTIPKLIFKDVKKR
ncbi:MAG: substrate-binding domain-containing protein [Candidatus Lokiarchaeota archaeon]|nr:substrate-binding domain-containing protein [Candidatus Lokiarchaeota archaeon]